MKAIARFDHVSQAQFERDSAGFEQVLPVNEIPLPRRATVGSAGYDIVCPVHVTIKPGETCVVPTGIRCVMEPGWVLLCCPRSSMGRKYGMRLANTIGVIDSEYAQSDNEGHILIAVVNGGAQPFTLHCGDRMGQGLFVPHGFAEESEVTAERRGGYGSTGR